MPGEDLHRLRFHAADHRSRAGDAIEGEDWGGGANRRVEAAVLVALLGTKRVERSPSIDIAAPFRPQKNASSRYGRSASACGVTLASSAMASMKS